MEIINDVYVCFKKMQLKFNIGTIYLIKGDGKNKNTYDEYFWNDASDAPGYEKFGGIDIDLTGFVKMPEIVEYIKNNGSLDLANDGTLSLTIN